MLRNRKLQWSVVVAVIAAAVGVVLIDAPAEARPGRPGPGPLCGFTALWNCDMPFGPDIQIAGTRCEIAQFERETGASCELAGS